MEGILEELYDKRKRLHKKLSAIGDFRRGIISVNYRKCGKQNCSCAKEGHPGHGPQYLWNTTIKGKSYAKSIPLGAELWKYTQETDNYRKFTELCSEIIDVNEKICNLREVPTVDDNEAASLKKKLLKRFKTKYKEKLARL